MLDVSTWLAARRAGSTPASSISFVGENSLRSCRQNIATNAGGTTRRGRGCNSRLRHFPLRRSSSVRRARMFHPSCRRKIFIASYSQMVAVGGALLTLSFGERTKFGMQRLLTLALPPPDSSSVLSLENSLQPLRDECQRELHVLRRSPGANPGMRFCISSAVEHRTTFPRSLSSRNISQRPPRGWCFLSTELQLKKVTANPGGFYGQDKTI